MVKGGPRAKIQASVRTMSQGVVIAGTSSRLIYWLDLWVNPPYCFTLTSGIVGNFSLFDNK